MARRAFICEQAFIDLLSRLARPIMPRPILGIGDDAAVLTPPARSHILITTDMLTDGVHFRTAYTPGFLLGRKALSVNLSDIAAMGGKPLSCVIAIGFPRNTSPHYAREVARGLADMGRRSGVAIVGGDTCAARALFLNVTLLGCVERGRAVRRDGARAGDALFVTGRLGASGAGLRLLERGANPGGRRTPAGKGRVAAARRRVIRAHLDPTPRMAAGRALGVSGLAGAMIDLSDGLAQDLPRLCGGSGVGAVVLQAAIPVAPEAEVVLGPKQGLREALTGGEDYELLFAARPKDAGRVALLARRLGLPMTRIGQIVPARSGIRLLGYDGRYRPLPSGGFEHFK